MSRSLNSRISSKHCDKRVAMKRRKISSQEDEEQVAEEVDKVNTNVEDEPIVNINNENDLASIVNKKRNEQGSVSGNTGLQIVSKETKLQFFETIVSYLTSFPAKDFFTEVIRNEIEESSRRTEFMFGALFKAMEETVRHKECLKDFKKPTTYFDFTMCEDEHFQEMVHVTRKTAKTIIGHIRGIPVDVDYSTGSFFGGLTHNNEPIDKILFLVLWYLSNKEAKLEEAVGMFELGSVENAWKLLKRGLFLILKLKGNAGLLWPTSDEFLVASNLIERRFSFPNVAGAMGHHIIICENGQRLMLQAVCDVKSMFIDVFTSFDTRPRIVFKQSMLNKKIQELKNGLTIVCEDISIPEKSSKNMLFPYKKGPVEASAEEQLFNLMHEFVLGIVKEGFKKLFIRFPRLTLMDRCEPEIVNAACVLYNYCVKLEDLTPL